MGGSGSGSGGFVDVDMEGGSDDDNMAGVGVWVRGSDRLDGAVAGIEGAGASIGVSVDGSVRGSFHRGHFFVSGESSGTSTISLQIQKN